MKKNKSIFLGIAIVVVGILVFTFQNGQDSDTLPDNSTEVAPVEIKIKPVHLTNIPYVMEATGTLQAKEKIELFSEVQGVLQKTKIPFKIGNRFKKGQPLIAIESKEHEAQIKSSRSNLMNQIAAMLPDMEIDYPNIYRKWEIYLENLNVESITPPLPEFSSNGEKLFISGKNIYSTYFDIKNLEERLDKYYIKAPFNGIITESNVNVGTLIRSSQKLGEFVDDSKFELQLSIPASNSHFLEKGTLVNLKKVGSKQSITGSVQRINGKINQDTQSLDIIVEVSGNNLKDGEYLEAQIQGNELNDVFRLSNTLILENNNVYVVEDNMLKLIPVEVLNYQDNMAIVSGLDEHMVIVDERIASSYPGMPVQITN